MTKKAETELHPTEEEIAYHKRELVPIIQARLGKEDVEEDVEKILQDCIKGWPKAPKSFAKRVQKRAKLYGTDGEGIDNLIQNKAGRPKGRKSPSKPRANPTLSRMKARMEAFSKSYESFTKQLNEAQRAYFVDRLEFYIGEFDFNMSSDLSLLMQLIMDELHISELQVAMVTAEKTSEKISITKAINVLTENVIGLQKILGVTREQRQKGMSGKEGSIAQISMSYEEKLTAIEKIARKEEEQERLLLQAKIKRGDQNKIPDDKNELKQILDAEEELRKDA